MKLIDAPDKIVLPFADAGGKNSIPVPSQIGITPGAASYTDGFPPLTRTEKVAGGLPPDGLDMNGVLFSMSAIERWANTGASFVYDSAFATDIGGYPIGTTLLRTDGEGYWLNTADDNLTDPEAGGAGWVPGFTTGITPVTMTSSNVTLTALESGRPIIVISGTLTANLNLIFPAIEKQWTVINNTIGGYSITCKTASGTGVVADLSGVIYGDGVNIYSAVNDKQEAINWLSPTSISSFSVAGTTWPAVSRLNATDFAYIDATNDELRTYRWDNSVKTFSLVGSGLSIAVGSKLGLASLSSTRVALVDDASNTLQAYDWNGSTWASVGSGLTITSMGLPAICALSSSRIAYVDATNDRLRAYDFDGTNWTLTGSELDISGILLDFPAMTAMDSSTVLLCRDGTLIYRYVFDGSTWTQSGVGSTGYGTIFDSGHCAISMINSTDLLFASDANNILRVLRYNGKISSSFTQVGSALSVSHDTPALCAMNGMDVVFVAAGSANLQLIRCEYSPSSEPYTL